MKNKEKREKKKIFHLEDLMKEKDSFILKKRKTS